MPIQVFVIDRHEVVRFGLTHAISGATGLKLAGESKSFPTGREAMLASRPDVVIADFNPNSRSQSEIVAALRSEMPDLRLLAFNTIDTPEMADSLRESGVHGYLVKDSSLDDVILAIRSIHAGRTFFSHTHTAVPRPHSEADRGPLHVPGPTKSARNLLSDREREVVLMLAEGQTNKEVAHHLVLSIKTVETYRSRVMKKFQLNGRAELFRFAKTLSSQH